MSETDTAPREFRLGGFLAVRVALIVVLLGCYVAFLVAGLITSNWLIGANGHAVAHRFYGPVGAGLARSAAARSVRARGTNGSPSIISGVYSAPQ